MSKARADTAYEVANWLAYLTLAEVDALKAIIHSLPNNPKVVNIGAGGGTSGLAIMETRDDVHLTTIDKTLESHPYGCLAAETTVLTDAGILPNALDRYHQIHGDSKSVGEHWLKDDQKVDFVFVDGDHSFSGARGDITLWLQNLKEDGIIAVHDYKKTELYIRKYKPEYLDFDTHATIKPWFHVDAAVDELLVPHYEQILHIDTLIAFRI